MVKGTQEKCRDEAAHATSSENWTDCFRGNEDRKRSRA